MNKATRNPNGKYLPVDVACKKYNLGRTFLVRLANKYGALIKLSPRCVRLDVEIFETGMKNENR